MWSLILFTMCLYGCHLITKACFIKHISKYHDFKTLFSFKWRLPYLHEDSKLHVTSKETWKCSHLHSWSYSSSTWLVYIYIYYIYICKPFTDLLYICVLGTRNKSYGLAHIKHVLYHLGIFSTIFSKLFSVFESYIATWNISNIFQGYVHPHPWHLQYTLAYHALGQRIYNHLCLSHVLCLFFAFVLFCVLLHVYNRAVHFFLSDFIYFK